MCRHDSFSTLGCTCSWWKAGTGLPEHEWRTTERKVITSERYCEAVGERKAGLRKLRPHRSAIASADTTPWVFRLPSLTISPDLALSVFVPVQNWSNIWKTSICVRRWSQDGVNLWLCRPRWQFCRDGLRKLVNVGEIDRVGDYVEKYVYTREQWLQEIWLSWFCSSICIHFLIKIMRHCFSTRTRIPFQHPLLNVQGYS